MITAILILFLDHKIQHRILDVSQMWLLSRGSEEDNDLLSILTPNNKITSLPCCSGPCCCEICGGPPSAPASLPLLLLTPGGHLELEVLIQRLGRTHELFFLQGGHFPGFLNICRLFLNQLPALGDLLCQTWVKRR